MDRLAFVVLLATIVPLANAQKLTGNSTGSGTSCIPDPYNIGLGQGCDASEGCCPQTNTCVRRGSCEEYITICPPPTCGKDKAFSDTECPKEVTKIFKNPKNLKCRASSDSMCYSNGTHLVLACKNAAGAVGAHMMAALLSVLLSLAVLVTFN